LQGPSIDLVLRAVDYGGTLLESVRLVLLIVEGPQEGENDFVEFPSVEAAVAYAREVSDDPRCQLEGIEDLGGRLIVGYDHLRDLCREAAPAPPQRKYG